VSMEKERITQKGKKIAPLLYKRVHKTLGSKRDQRERNPKTNYYLELAGKILEAVRGKEKGRAAIRAHD